MNNAGSSAIRRFVWLALLLAVVCAFAFQGSRGLYETTEGRYALCALEMVKSGNWMEPTITGVHHWTKPPLGYWAIAGGIKLAGVNEWGARLSNALALCLTALFVGLLAARMWNDRRTGVLAALVYATAIFPVATANTVNTDTLLCLWETLALFCFWRGVVAARPESGRWWMTGMWAAFGLGFLTKGPPVLLPLLAVVAWNFSRPKADRCWGAIFNPAGIALFFAVGFWWFLAMIVRHPELLDYYLKKELVDRVATNEFGRNPEWYAPFMLYFPVLLFGGGLWSFYFWRPLRSGGWRRKDSWTALWRASGPKLFLVLWLALPLAVFCVSQSRLTTYVLPLFAPVALAAARLARNTDWTGEQPRRRVLVFALAAAALLVAGKGFMGFIPEMQAALEVSGSKSAKQLEGNLKRNMSAMYAVCRPFDAATGVRILMMDENEKLGFDFYARAPVTRVGLGSDGVAPDKRTEKNRKLLLEPVLRDSLARGEHLLAVCDSVSMKDFERQLWQAGWSFKTLAFKRSCNVVELVPPRPSNRLPPVLMQLRRLSRASSPSAPGLAP